MQGFDRQFTRMIRDLSGLPIGIIAFMFYPVSEIREEILQGREIQRNVIFHRQPIHASPGPYSDARFATKGIHRKPRQPGNGCGVL
jgi:hypothetical protein